MTITVPRLAKGKGYKGPEFAGCFNTGCAPSIFHSRTGRYVVGPETLCRDAMRDGLTLMRKRVHGKGGRRIWLFRSRGPALVRFLDLCEAQERENEAVRREFEETRAKATRGDIAAALHLGDF